MNTPSSIENSDSRLRGDYIEEDAKWMMRALSTAADSAARGEVPVGAVLVKNNRLICEGGNSPIGLNDPTAHAEIVVIRTGAIKLNNYRLPGTTLYVTLEPCIMCVGAMLHARIGRLVYGAPDPKSGAVSSVYTIGSDGLLNHTMEIAGPVLRHECASVLKDFFTGKRNTLKPSKQQKM